MMQGVDDPLFPPPPLPTVKTREMNMMTKTHLLRWQQHYSAFHQTTSNLMMMNARMVQHYEAKFEYTNRHPATITYFVLYSDF